MPIALHSNKCLKNAATLEVSTSLHTTAGLCRECSHKLREHNSFDTPPKGHKELVLTNNITVKGIQFELFTGSTI